MGVIALKPLMPFSSAGRGPAAVAYPGRCLQGTEWGLRIDLEPPSMIYD